MWALFCALKVSLHTWCTWTHTHTRTERKRKEGREKREEGKKRMTGKKGQEEREGCNSIINLRILTLLHISRVISIAYKVWDFSVFGNKTSSQRKQITVPWRTADTKSHSFKWRSWNCMSKRRTIEEPILRPLGPFPLRLVFFPLPIPLRLLMTHFPSLFTAHSFHTCLVLPVGELPGQGHCKIQTSTHSSEGHMYLLHHQKLPLGQLQIKYKSWLSTVWNMV